MIRKLRRKFIFINMTLVTLILCIVFGIFLFSRLHFFRAESELAMLQLLEHSRLDKELPPKENAEAPSTPNISKHGDAPKLDLAPNGRNKAFNATPVFLTILDKNNQLSETISTGSYDVTETLAAAAVEAALASSKEQGYLSNLKLRFICQETPFGMKIAFADTVQELRTLGEFILQCIFMFLLFLFCFLIVSIFLARWALKPVETAWEQQNQFIADASHELKTPLTVILANLRILLSHSDSTIQKEMKWIENTQEEAGHMKNLVENLLFLARSDAGSTPKVYATFSLSDLLLGCLLTFEPIAFEEGILIEEHIAENLCMSGDEEQIRRLFAILLDNACKYAGSGCKSEKKVSVSLQLENEKRLLIVHNTGSPIPEADLPHLFERFYRTSKSRSRSDGGYGLGLPIASVIVKNHHGKISVTSTEENGTAFRVILPSEQPD